MRTQRVIWWTSKTQVETEINYLGGLAQKLARAAPGPIPTGAGDLNGLAPAEIEAFHRYME